MKKEVEITFLNALEKNQEKLFRICSIYSDNHEDAKDLFQEILVQIWGSMNSFKGNSSISTWMFRIAINSSLRFRSIYTRNRKRFIRLDSITISDFKSETNNKEANEKLKALRNCIEKLNESDKAIVVLYLEGLAYREISNIVGLSENHIAVKIKRIKSKLLNCINQIL